MSVRIRALRMAVRLKLKVPSRVAAAPGFL